MKRTTHVLGALIIAAAIGGPPQPAHALNTAEIVTSATSTDCLEFEVVGVCVWLTCTPFGCYTNTSVKVGHYIPELVVSSYQETGANPWSETAKLSPRNSKSKEGGLASEGRNNIHTSMRFKNADAIGHPLPWVVPGIGCRSPATPLLPYFLSVLDPYGWRDTNGASVEKFYPQALTPGLREVRRGALNMWGALFPRSGFITQSHDYKAAAVIAQRVADFVTRRGQPHLYTPLTPVDREGFWAPGPVREGDEDTHKWQRLTPNRTRSCAVFPDRGPLASFRGDLTDDGDYAWALWRPYSCCKRRGEDLIYDSGDYP